MEISGFFWGVNFCDVQRATRLLTESDPKMRERHQFEEHPQETVWKCVGKDSTRIIYGGSNITQDSKGYENMHIHT